ncbi:von Willebrand factor type A domain-containing protein [Salegentibacter sp. BDJ18]|uniref:vWA domain-containing protein n=1 Tax=Salegentibacter sp. BDJ18 TaxID=2816376 RepID=UPI001AAF73FE|nr:VWA domain-containing protein [Salegentibacter sp. BDJ18]MBO2543368.1 von Willebrand factor type A domain-containing protein [Salegentibacter sp. BDJ18]
MKYNLLFILSLFLCNSISAQTITGTVSNENSTPLPGVNILNKSTNSGTQTDFDGKYSIKAKKGDLLTFSFIGYKTKEVKVKDKKVINVSLEPYNVSLNEEVVAVAIADSETIRIRGTSSLQTGYGYNNRTNTEAYKERNENIFKSVKTAPLSTFSIDVDRASYSNIRRMVNNGQEIPKGAVKIEEMINYFNYNYAGPKDEHPFAIHTEVAKSPWNQQTKIAKIALQGKNIPTEDIPASNLTFLLDVSGSMNSPNKVPLLKSSFKILVNQLREEDRVAIVVYAGAAGVVLESTPGSEKIKILEAINNLNAGGSTAGGEGIQLAYKIAKENFIEGGNNRVILATDGDFNIGASSDSAMKELIEEKRESGVFLTVLGFGMGNYKDSKLESLAQAGNGNHAYIDSMQESRRVLGTEFGGTLHTIAKDVKIQVEFNPEKIQAYRLIGYENRLLIAEDFNDDEKDAGELGSGHTVTALYELIPVGVESEYLKEIDSLKYTNTELKNNSGELFTVKFRYKDPEGAKSKLITKTVADTEKDFEEASADFKFAAAVALYGMKLTDSEFVKNHNTGLILDLAEKGRREDKEGYRAEFIRLVKSEVN